MTTRAVEARRRRHLLTRILDTPNLAQVVRSLEPAVLHQLVRRCGLEDCGEILGLATAEQLMRVFDDDLWRSDKAGEEDQFDADRFGLWLEVLAETGVATAVQKIVEMDFDFVTAALSRHLLVLDQESRMLVQAAADAGVDDSDPTENARDVSTEKALENGLSYDIGGYRVIAKRGESWDALLSVLVGLEDGHHGFFDRLMKRCSHLSTEYIEDNGGLFEVLTADEQIMADIASDRERRREREGYVTPSQAAIFLRLSRERPKGQGGVSPARDPVTAGYFRESEPRAEGRSGRAKAPRGEEHRGKATERQVNDFLATLQEGGVIKKPRPFLLPKGMAAGGSRLSRIRAQLLFVQEHDDDAYSRRMEEMAYLANVLVAGCSLESRRFGAGEAADAVLATCNLGLENWPWRAAAAANPKRLPDLLLRQDLVTVFRNGWSVVYEKVCLFVAKSVVEILSDLKCDDDEVQGQLAELSQRMKIQVDAGTPWRERDSLDVIAILDQPSWATLLRLVDECPTVPNVADQPAEGRPPLRMASEFEFISENAQVTWVRDFVRSLPGRLLER